MGSQANAITFAQMAPQDKLLTAFARLMWETYGARIYLFGSRVRGTETADSDYDVVAVSDAFAGQRSFKRVADRYRIWRQAGGWGIGLDLHCYTPEEFRRELSGFGYLGQAEKRGELLQVHFEVAC